MSPTLQALWLVDSVDHDESTGKISLRGLFDRLVVSPGTESAGGATVFFAVRGIHGEARLRLLYVDLSDDEILIERPVRVEGEPLDTTDLSVRVNRIPVPHPGMFAWELYFENDLLGSARIEVAYGGETP
jgi:hypothetical protein